MLILGKCPCLYTQQYQAPQSTALSVAVKLERSAISTLYALKTETKTLFDTET